MNETDKKPFAYRSIGIRIAAWWSLLRRRSLEASPQKRVALVGSPNVGKSLIFNRLTGIYVTVSNYPGTTVEIFRGRTYIEGVLYEIIDTPGMYSLLPSSEDERVARRLLMEERPDVVVHVVDAKNLERMLPLTLQLIEAGF
ncbi:MAG: FeoB small GTPase domain-containing protein, partial [Armatimonadota bacterium]